MVREQFKRALDRIKTQVLSLSLDNKVHNSTKFLIAYSGGMDSHVLLTLCSDLGLDMRVVYIHHGLQAEADSWQQHCLSVCQQLNIKYESIKVDATPQGGQSPEEAARVARYNALRAILAEDECLLTAHHRDDQAETLLLQLMRGSGAAGLASMPEIQTFGEGWHARPMLDLNRNDIEHYARQKNLQWVDDPSNNDTSFDRNFLRQNIMPVLQERWPQANRSLKLAADIQQESLTLLNDMAAIDLANIVSDNPCIISIKPLLKLSISRQFNVLKFWVKRSGLDKPSRNILQQILTTVVTAAEDAAPLVAWSNTEIRRFKEALYIMPSSKTNNAATTYQWNPENNLNIEWLNSVLSYTQNVSQGMPANLLNKNLRVKFRQGGEKIKPAGRQHTVSLKHLMQQAEIPPWQRSKIPLLYEDDILICVCGYWLADDYMSFESDCWLPVLNSRA